MAYPTSMVWVSDKLCLQRGFPILKQHCHDLFQVAF